MMILAANDPITGGLLLIVIFVVFVIGFIVACLFAVWFVRQVVNLFNYLFNPVFQIIHRWWQATFGRIFSRTARMWEIYSVRERRRTLCEDIEHFGDMNFSLEELQEMKLMTEEQLQDRYDRIKLAYRLEKTKGSHWDWKKYSLPELRQMLVNTSATNISTKPKPKIATVGTSSIKMCSKGLLINISANRFVLVDGTPDEMKDLAKLIFKTFRKTNLPVTGTPFSRIAPKENVKKSPDTRYGLSLADVIKKEPDGAGQE